MGEMRFIADLHFGHANILAYDNREFKDIQTHDSTLIRLWNERVHKDDVVWILGDISWLNEKETEQILRQLNGELRLCIGNHDHKLLKKASIRSCFTEIVDYKEIKLDARYGLVLCHYPIPCFNNHYTGWTHLYGHVHNGYEWSMMEQCRYQSESLYQKPCDMINVGCMMPYMEYYPLTLEEIKERYAKYKSREE